MNHFYLISIYFLILLFVLSINLDPFYSEMINAQKNDAYTIEQIRHMPGHGPRHAMMMDRMHPSDSNDTQSMMTVENATLDSQNQLPISIVLGAISKTIDAYQPNPAYIESGQTILWTNNDNFFHTVTQSSFNGVIEPYQSRFDSGIMDIGQSFSHSFDVKGEYDYYCTIHPWMAGKIFVTPNMDSSVLSDTKNISSLSKSQ